MLKIAICDDEKNVCDYIEKRTRDYLAKIDEEAELAVFLDGTPLIDHCKDIPNDFDIIFLDIKMKTVNGVDCAKHLRDLGVEALIVFVTSSAEYVFSGYEVKAFRYILKTDLVNARKIKSVSKDSAELLNDEILPVSKSKASAVKNAYLWAKR